MLSVSGLESQWHWLVTIRGHDEQKQSIDSEQFWFCSDGCHTQLFLFYKLSFTTQIQQICFVNFLKSNALFTPMIHCIFCISRSSCVSWEQVTSTGREHTASRKGITHCCGRHTRHKSCTAGLFAIYYQTMSKHSASYQLLGSTRIMD